MGVRFTIISGPSSGRQVELDKPGIVRIGRTSEAGFATQDSFMSRIHFELEWDGTHCLIRDLNSRNGTQVNGTNLVGTVTVRNNDRILAGQTELVADCKENIIVPSHTDRIPSYVAPKNIDVAPPVFMQRIHEHAVKSKQSVFTGYEPQASVVGQTSVAPVDLFQFLRNQSSQLFAILDAARDPMILELLQQSEIQFQSLYDGEKGDELAAYAPYLVQLPVESPVLERLVHGGWGKAWGVYLTCNEPFDVVRKHMRHFLFVQAEDGRKLYFRFYDPRVLRNTLPLFDPEEATRFFGQLGCYLLEGKDPAFLLRFTNGIAGIEHNELPLLDRAAQLNLMSPATHISTETTAHKQD
ncbi:MAG: DUF4123 domain-containing protein [Desulfuromonadaceae bacterium]